MTMVIMTVIVVRIRRVGMGAVAMIVMLDRIAARVARMRTEDSDQARENRADQRQKDDCLDHLAR
jgi:hypothetical protein